MVSKMLFPCYVYIVATIGTDHDSVPKAPIKVGFSGNPMKRARQLQKTCPHFLCTVHTFKFSCRADARECEQHFHRSHDESRTRSEWYDLSPAAALEFISRYIHDGIQKRFSSSLPPAKIRIYEESVGLTKAYEKIAGWREFEALRAGPATVAN